MAERYEDQHRRDRGYRRDERGFIDRAGDEVRSWFGDDDAERRRQLDDRDRYRGYTNDRNNGGYYSDRSSYADRGWSDRPHGYGDRGYGTRDYANRDYANRDYGNRDSGDDYWRVANYSGREGYPGSFRDQQGFDAGSRGSFAGRGPKGYQRSDARINEDVCDRLCDSPDIDATNVDVRVNAGEVTLSGTVSSRDEKRRAEDMIEHVSGVREVHNNLRVGRADETSPPYPAGSTTNVQGSNETPGSTLGLTGQPDRASTAGRR